ncbi:MAG: hypothetical protein COA97_06720 [Flavobacteriales bacterium]|nr:MAG: hypothetical protein COA97_06720 [Flavobacteriales bacterium]
MKDQKKILMLGGSDIQTSAIKRAVELGYYVITADYLPENPGHKYSHEYYDISTIDKDKIFELAKKLEVDGILAYASDPGAESVAYVGEKLGLNTNSFNAVSTLSHKTELRSLMKKHHLPNPAFEKIISIGEIKEFIQKNGKSIVKAVNSSGSKGITVVNENSDFEFALNEALKYSGPSHVLIEEYIEKSEMQFCGDLFVQDGEIIFYSFGNVHFDNRCNPLVPCSITLPTINGSAIEKKAIEVIQEIFDILSIKTGGFNVDVFQVQNEVYIIEIGARNGGNLFTEIIQEHTNVNLVDFVIDASVGKKVEVPKKISGNGYHAHYVIHSIEDGILDKIEFTNEINDNIIFKVIKIKSGEEVKKFNGSNTRIGVVLLRFDSHEEMFEKVKNMDNFIKVNLR